LKWGAQNWTQYSRWGLTIFYPGPQLEMLPPLP